MPDDGLLLLIAIVAVGALLAVPILLVVALGRLSDLTRRVQLLERQIAAGWSAAQPGSRPAATITQLVAPPAEPGPPAAAPGTPAPIPQFSAEPAPATQQPWPARREEAFDAIVVDDRRPEPWSLETLIGRHALGWVAVIVLLFATAFFLRYAFENQWIGPLGRVALGLLAGFALAYAGSRYFLSGWVLFSQMLTAAGIVLLYLATYSAFGFYHLLEQRAAGAFLVVIVVESALLALRYDAPAIALMAVIGGLLSPLLMHTDRDQYTALFAYLAVLNAGVVGLLLRRAWPLVGSVALAGTQALYWMWHFENYHPQKLPWALGFQLVLYGLYLLHTLLLNRAGSRRATEEDLLRMAAAPVLLSAAAYVILDEDYHRWLGSLAVAMATLYALVTRWLLAERRADRRPELVALAIACGFIAVAIPLEADAPWVALGWAAEAAALWWFGLRIAALPLRAMAAGFALLAALRILYLSADVPPLERPVLNDYALPALLAVGLLLTALAATRRYAKRLTDGEPPLVGGAVVGGVLLVWYVESQDIHAFFMQHRELLRGFDARRASQMTLSAWWAVYATAVLAIGFARRLALLRWTALGLYGLTIGKVFLFDMAGLDQIYRIVAFFVLALVLGLAAWAYQRFQPDEPASALHAKER